MEVFSVRPVRRSMVSSMATSQQAIWTITSSLTHYKDSLNVVTIRIIYDIPPGTQVIVSVLRCIQGSDSEGGRRPNADLWSVNPVHIWTEISQGALVRQEKVFLQQTNQTDQPNWPTQNMSPLFMAVHVNLPYVFFLDFFVRSFWAVFSRPWICPPW